MERRLAAIMIADVVGYSRLVRTDEEGTVAAFKALHTDVIGPRITGNQGRVVKLLGDGIMAEFKCFTAVIRATLIVTLGIIAPPDHNPVRERFGKKTVSFRVVRIFFERRIGQANGFLNGLSAVTEMKSHSCTVQQCPSVQAFGRHVTTAPPLSMHQLGLKLADD